MNDLVPAKEERLLKPAEVAEVLSISKALVYRLIQQGVIPSVRINHAVRVMPSDLEGYIKQCRNNLIEG